MNQSGQEQNGTGNGIQQGGGPENIGANTPGSTIVADMTDGSSTPADQASSNG